MIRFTMRSFAAVAFSPAFSNSRNAFLICLWSSLSWTMASVDMAPEYPHVCARNGARGPPRRSEKTMKAAVWHGKRDVRVDDVPDPVIQEPTDAIVRITSSGLCGSDLHLYEVLGPFMTEGDILGHEPMGIVEEVGSAVPNLTPGDRVVMPFQISC